MFFFLCKSLGKSSGWEEYRIPDSFSPCPFPGHQSCLDQYRTDGSIQFKQECRFCT